MLFIDFKIFFLIKGIMLFFVIELFGGKVFYFDMMLKVIGRFF